MATIVKQKSTGQKFILIGSGYGIYRSATRLVSVPLTDRELFPMAALTNGEGEIIWMRTEELQVMEVDGVQINRNFVLPVALWLRFRIESVHPVS